MVCVVERKLLNHKLQRARMHGGDIFIVERYIAQ